MQFEREFFRGMGMGEGQVLAAKREFSWHLSPVSRFVRVPLDLSGLPAMSLELPREAAHYLIHVHRVGEGDAFVAFDPQLGLEAQACVTQVERTRVYCKFSAPTRVPRSPLPVGLLQATAKGDRIEQVVRAATALGAQWVRLVICERSVARPSELRGARLQAIALDAARQSGRGDLPVLEGPFPLAEALNEPWSGTSLCAALGGARSIVERVAAWDLTTPARVLIGPEGGLSPEELSSADRAGFERVSLGPFTLRTELAASSALACFAGRVPSAS